MYPEAVLKGVVKQREKMLGRKVAPRNVSGHRIVIMTYLFNTLFVWFTYPPILMLSSTFRKEKFFTEFITISLFFVFIT